MSRRSALSLLDRLVARVERADWIDAPAARVHGAATRLTRAGEPVRDALSGTGFGHPAHPALVLAPLGCWLGAVTRSRRRRRTSTS